MLLLWIVTFWLVPRPANLTIWMPRYTPFWIEFSLTARPLTPPPITSCDPPFDPVMALRKIDAVVALMRRTPWPLPVIALLLMVMFDCALEPRFTATLRLLANVLASMVTLARGPDTDGSA